MSRASSVPGQLELKVRRVDGKLVRAILDTGSQKSYVSQYIAQTLGLKSLGKQKITHGLFGGPQMTEINVDEIHILLGADIVGKLFTGEIKQVSKGLTAVNTKLGWTVLGKSNSESTFETRNSLLVQSLLTN
ncbi:uncharacterized protein LOC129958472 [Argiope bruennichi]|uniref:uncharacterized protein LOC129958472 n=1 Tax=Argiope bruennichi TaxID=94029 RepID=UPI00249475E0|nr:uncharacterized protein LOC129958472 [Argiope bruennichi]